MNMCSSLTLSLSYIYIVSSRIPSSTNNWDSAIWNWLLKPEQVELIPNSGSRLLLHCTGRVVLVVLGNQSQLLVKRIVVFNWESGRNIICQM